MTHLSYRTKQQGHFARHSYRQKLLGKHHRNTVNESKNKQMALYLVKKLLYCKGNSQQNEEAPNKM